jgi:uncharacterized damage-inducible protein DinB
VRGFVLGFWSTPDEEIRMTDRAHIAPLAGFQSREVSLFISQLDDQTQRLARAVADLSPDELAWQPRPGMNTIGMLITHLAIVEVWWTAHVTRQDSEEASRKVGIGFDDDGMPLKDDGLPPAALAGKDVAYFMGLLERSRRFVKDSLAGMPDSGLEAEIERTRPDGTKRIVTGRWILYHILEHFSGHFGQVLLLHHLYRVERVTAGA